MKPHKEKKTLHLGEEAMSKPDAVMRTAGPDGPAIQNRKCYPR